MLFRNKWEFSSKDDTECSKMVDHLRWWEVPLKVYNKDCYESRTSGGTDCGKTKRSYLKWKTKIPMSSNYQIETVCCKYLKLRQSKINQVGILKILINRDKYVQHFACELRQKVITCHWTQIGPHFLILTIWLSFICRQNILITNRWTILIINYNRSCSRD